MDRHTRAGATDLALKMAEYWRTRGYRYFEAAAVPLGLNEEGRYSYGIRSNLDGRGFPPRVPTPIRSDTVIERGDLIAEAAL